MSSSSSAATAVTSASTTGSNSGGVGTAETTSVAPSGPHYRNVLAMMNIEKFVTENGTDLRHQKLLQNIVKILKINDLLEEYRGVVRSLQAACSCKRSKPTWDLVTGLEARYTELILESCRSPVATTSLESQQQLQQQQQQQQPPNSSAAALVREAGFVPAQVSLANSNLKNSTPNTSPIISKAVVNGTANSKTQGPTNATTQQHSGGISSKTDNNNIVNSKTNGSSPNVMNFSIFNSLKENASQGTTTTATTKSDVTITATVVNGSSGITGSVSTAALSNGTKTVDFHHNHVGKSLSPPLLRPEVIVEEQQQPPHQHHQQEAFSGDSQDDVNLIEEEDILEDEEDDAEEELDIEEYMALSEILEKEPDTKRFQREEDPKNEFILAIRDTRSQEIICYECVVGGSAASSCGFLSRERVRMLLHIGKHFAAAGANGNGNGGDGCGELVENEDDGVLTEDEEDDDEYEEDKMVAHALGHGGSGVDISIIPLNADGSRPGLHSMGVNGSNGGSRRGNNSNIRNSSSKIPSRSSSLYRQAQATKAHLLELQQQQQQSNSNTGNHKVISKPAEKPIHCEWDTCTFQCDQNYKLRTHIRQVHEKVRPYLCDWPGCYGAYKTRSNLASHRMVHTGERPFICDFPRCGAKFARKYDCERHRRIHSEKMFACEWPGCGKRLCDPYNLERHMMVHKGELPFRCPIGKCVRGFRELRYLRDHMVNTHKFLPDTNQLRIACLNSAKVSSISGYNLNEEDGGGGGGFFGEGGDGSMNADMAAFVNAIVASAQAARIEEEKEDDESQGHSEEEEEDHFEGGTRPGDLMTMMMNTAEDVEENGGGAKRAGKMLNSCFRQQSSKRSKSSTAASSVADNNNNHLPSSGNSSKAASITSNGNGNGGGRTPPAKNTRGKQRAAAAAKREASPSPPPIEEPAVVVEVYEPVQTRRSKRVRR